MQLCNTLQPMDAKLTFTLNGYLLSQVDKVRFNGLDLTSATSLVATTSSSSYTISIQFTTDISSAFTYDIIIYNLVNLDSQTTCTIIAETTLSSYKISSTQIGSTLPASIPNQITILSMTQENQFLEVVGVYQFRLSLYNSLSAGCSIIVIIPENFQTEMADCQTAIEDLSGFTIDTCQVNGKEINIKTKTAESTKTIQFKLNNLIRNPKTYSSSYYFQLRTEKNSFIMDKSGVADSQARFSLKCLSSFNTSFCKDCDVSGNCLSCYTDTTITSHIYLQNNKCTCGQKFYSDANNQCQSCSDLCLECTSSSLCQTCTDEAFFEIKNGKCVQKCAEKQFYSNGIVFNFLFE